MTTSVAPNANNTLTVPELRLPLGVAVVAGDGTRWAVRIPTKYGGVLKVTVTGAQIDIQQPPGTSLVGTTATPNEMSAAVTFGKCLVVITGGSGALLATLVQKASSRVADPYASPGAAPLLPWNFYYWPSVAYAAQANDVLTRYATAVGKSPSDATAWERANHQSDHFNWAGHCALSAAASALFEQPTAQTINGQPFTEDEMEFLAAEWYGVFGKDGDVLWLDTENIKPAGKDILYFLKPGGPKDRQALIQGFSPFFAASEAVSRADGWMNGDGGEQAFTANRRAAFGKIAANFFAFIQDKLCGAGHPLESNMRSYNGNESPQPVWNQAFFYYEATFEETWPRNPYNDHDIKVTCTLYSNIDNPPPTTGLPGTVTDNTVTPGTSSTDCWLYKHVYRIVFDDDGMPNAGADENDWVSLQNDQGQELYAPQYLSTLATPSTSPAPGKDNTFLEGNPTLGAEFLHYVTIRDRFK